VMIGAYNDHCSAPSSEPLVWFNPSLLGCRSRHCYGINVARNPSAAAGFGIRCEKACSRQPPYTLEFQALLVRECHTLYYGCFFSLRPLLSP